MASISPIPKMKLKLLVDKNSEKVVFAEADKDFIDFLIHLLSLPVATAVRLLKEKTMDVGSLSHFYESLQNLPDSYLKPNQNKYSLLNPIVPIFSAAAAATEISLALTSDGREFDTLNAYTCASCISHMAVVPNLICPKCKCRSMNRELSYVNPPWKGGGFLKGLVSYIVMDNLEFMPMSTKMFVSLLNKFDVKDVSALEETEVEVGVEERSLHAVPALGLKMMLADLLVEGGKGDYHEDGKLSCGYFSIRGKRETMEDFYDYKTSHIDGKSVCMFGVFDGHCGSRAAEYLKEHLFENLLKHPQFLTDTKLAISKSYQQTDVEFLDSERDSDRNDGSTATTAVLIGNHLYVANVGDSRTVISKAGKAIALSDDHKPDRPDERKRIKDAGGDVKYTDTWRVEGVLATSRAFGDRMLKQFVVSEPEIQDQEIDEEIELLLLASDGLWDEVCNDDAVELARTEEEPESAALKLTETAFTWGSADNITCIVVRFHHNNNADPAKSPA
ncbi:hypothetical protein LWI29_017683 [Acer saccharum]|uniref:protein-serine/threonine phosphatase n=1 Tax=Acer saccharum TaxID=4024 RepID=A0AA39SLA5_ACESA|nr:hypothetical protein LWI29_017683 [Acer saccharum]